MKDAHIDFMWLNSVLLINLKVFSINLLHIGCNPNPVNSEVPLYSVELSSRKV